jgi:hypothetical protein
VFQQFRKGYSTIRSAPILEKSVTRQDMAK